MAYSPDREQLLDPYEGRVDIAQRRLGCVGDAATVIALLEVSETAGASPWMSLTKKH